MLWRVQNQPQYRSATMKPGTGQNTQKDESFWLARALEFAGTVLSSPLKMEDVCITTVVPPILQHGPFSQLPTSSISFSSISDYSCAPFGKPTFHVALLQTQQPLHCGNC